MRENISRKPITTLRSMHPTLRCEACLGRESAGDHRSTYWKPIGRALEEVQYAAIANNDRNKDREERVTDLVRAPLEGDERKENEKNGKCCTNSDIKLIFFIMHQSSVLARAYFMQKQVLAFRSLLYFRDIYSDYTLFHGFVSLNSCLQAGHSNKRSEKAKANRN